MTVPTSSLVAMGAAAAFCVLLPVGVLVRWRRTERARLLPALWGALTFLLFARGLETGLHYFCILSDNAVSRVILSSPWLYMLYGALAAGIFEECGRFCMYKTVMRRYDGRAAAVTAGIGHGGIEAISITAVSLALYFVSALYWNAGDTDALLKLAGSMEAVQTLAASFGKYTVGYCLLACLERVSAMLLHISLSVFVFAAARSRAKRGYLAFAIGLHAIFDMPAALYQFGYIKQLFPFELWLAVCSLYALRSARKCYLEECDA